MAPAAAHLSLGFLPQDLGPPVNDLLLDAWPCPEREASAVVGQIIWIDSFGNLISNIQRDELPQAIDGESCFVQTDGRRIERIARTYADAPPGTLVALFGSSGYLELAVAQGNAAASLPISLGDSIKVQW
jgi:S-adenosylmethionine hydrolase